MAPKRPDPKPSLAEIRISAEARLYDSARHEALAQVRAAILSAPAGPVVITVSQPLT